MIGGLTSDRAIKLVRGLKDLNIVGMDVVEVAPAYDQSEITALAAATLALEMLYIQAAKKGRVSNLPGRNFFAHCPLSWRSRDYYHLNLS